MVGKVSGTSSLRDPINAGQRARVEAKSNAPYAGTDALHVIAETGDAQLLADLIAQAIVNNPPPSSGGKCSISKHLDITRESADLNLGSSYVTMYSYHGSGYYHGFAYEFNSNKVRIKLTVDGEVIFEETLQDIEDIARFGGGSTKGENRELMCGMFKIGSSDRLEFCPKCPLEFSSSVLLEGKKSTSSTKRVITRWDFVEKLT
jgi:hypothetical protein